MNLKSSTLGKKQPDHHFDQDANHNTYQIDETSVFIHIESHSKFTAAGPSKMYPEHPLHAVNFGAPDQSKRAITSLTQLDNSVSGGLIAEIVAPMLCSATMTALKTLKFCARPIAVG